MFFGNKYLIKAVASLLLVSLLLIHSLKLLHSHPTVLSLNDVHKHSAVVKDNSHCSICSYQLAKDADDKFCAEIQDVGTALTKYDPQLTTSYTVSFHPAFESRGPPCCS